MSEHQKQLCELMTLDNAQLAGAFLAAINTLFMGDDQKINIYVSSIVNEARLQTN